VRDSAALLDAIAGADLGAPYAAPPKARPFMDELMSAPRRLRIALMTSPVNGAPVHPECMEALMSAAALCRALGHEIVDERPALSEPAQFLEAFGHVYMVKAALDVEMAEAIAGRAAGEADIETLTDELARRGRALSATAYVNATRALHRAGRELARFMLDVDVLLTPTTAQPTVQIGELRYPKEDPVPDFLKAAAYTAFTPLFNATGQPAMSVPLHWAADGMPIGVQFAARLGDEASLFQLAAQLEQARPWAQRLPPLLLNSTQETQA